MFGRNIEEASLRRTCGSYTDAETEELGEFGARKSVIRPKQTVGKSVNQTSNGQVANSLFSRMTDNIGKKNGDGTRR